MGRIVASVKIENLADSEAKIRCDALVDTGASHMVLPNAWRDRLGELVNVSGRENSNGHCPDNPRPARNAKQARL